MLLLLIFTCLYGGSAASRCPQNALRDASRCPTKAMGDVRPTDMIPIIAGGSKALLDRFCVNKEYKQVVRCINQIADTCSAETRDLIYETFDVTRIDMAWKGLCENKAVYEYNIVCYKTQKMGLTKCIQQVAERMREKVHSAMSKDEIMEVTCMETTNGINCQDQIIRNSCGAEAAQIITDYSESTKPARCSGAICRVSLVLILLALLNNVLTWRFSG